MKEPPLVLRPDCAAAHEQEVKVRIAETTLVWEIGEGVFPMEVDFRARFADGTTTPWVRTVVDLPNQQKEFVFDTLKDCQIIGYDYQPHFIKRGKLQRIQTLIPGDVYTLKWSFNLDI